MVAISGKEMVVKPLSKNEKVFRTVLWGTLEIFAVGSLIYAIVDRGTTHILMCIATMLLLLLPFTVSKILRFEMNGVFFAFCELYAIGPMLGNVYNLYYVTAWWDDLLHASGGVVFAIFGVYLAGVFNKKGQTTLLMKAMFALSFSIALAGIWEFVEYGSDMLFHTDMQNDTVIHNIYSYKIGGVLGETGAIDGIEEVFVNGQSLGLNGYLDIGLHDTMCDMLIETLGAIVFVIVYTIDGEKHPLIYRSERKNKEKTKEKNDVSNPRS